MEKPYDGPFEVLKAGTKAFKVQVGNRQEFISVDRLKPGQIENHDNIQLGIPRRKGRPPKQKLNENISMCRGRPPKQQSTLAEENTVFPKRQGRPPKGKILNKP